MFKAKDKKGNVIEVSVMGSDYDDIQIESAYYEETGEEVPEDVIDYIYDTYGDKMYEEYIDLMIGMCDHYNDRYEDM